VNCAAVTHCSDVDGELNGAIWARKRLARSDKADRHHISATTNTVLVRHQRLGQLANTHCQIAPRATTFLVVYHSSTPPFSDFPHTRRFCCACVAPVTADEF